MPGGEIRGYGDKCLDVEGGSAASGTRVHMWDCHGGINQKFNLRGMIVGYGGNCLRVDPTRPQSGTVVEMWNCYGDAFGTRWDYYP